MKKLLAAILLLLVLCALCGCGTPKKEAPKNDVFTDEYFQGVKKMTLLVMAQPVTGEQMEPVIAHLKSLTLTPTETRLTNIGQNGEVLNGGPLHLVLEYDNGEQKTALVSTGIITFYGGGSYVGEDENFYRGLLEAFGKTWVSE